MEISQKARELIIAYNDATAEFALDRIGGVI